MRLTIYLFIIIFCFQTVDAQNNSLTKEKIDERLNDLELVYPDSEDDVKEIESLIASSKKIDYKQGIIKGKLNILSYLRRNSDYKQVLKVIEEIEALGTENPTQATKLYLYKSDANMELGIGKETLKNLKDALKHAKLIEDADNSHLSVSYVYNTLGVYYDKTSDSMLKYLNKELKELEEVRDDNPAIKIKKYMSLALNKINIGNFYVDIKPQRLDLAEPYFEEVYDYRTRHPEVFEQLDLPILCGVGNFYLAKGDYKKSLNLFYEVLKIEKYKQNPTYRSYAYSALADVYEGLNNAPEQVKYSKLYVALSDSINKAAKKEVGQQFDTLITKVEEKNASNVKSIILASLGCILLLGILFWVYWTQKNKVLHKKYEAIISKIKSETDTQTQTEAETQIYHEEKVDVNQVSPTVGITDETIKALSRRLEKFEQSKSFLKKDMSSPSLANHLNTNTKYLTEIIKLRSNTSYTSYINGLRIGYVTRKLVEDPVYREYKIEYLAEECGYASRQVFINAFKRETGVTPSYFIENLKKDGGVNVAV